MKKLKIALCILVLNITFFTLTSCKPISGKNIAVQTSEEIMRCFNEKDAESLKSMFFANDLPTSNLDKQIREAFEFYKGPSVSYYIPKGFGGGKSVDDGKITRWDIRPSIKNIETDSGITYNIGGKMYLIYNGEEVNKISFLTIYDKNNTDDEVVIGQIF